MNSNLKIKEWLDSPIVTLAICAAVALILAYLLKGFWLLIALSASLSYLLNKIIKWLERQYNLNHILAVTIILVSFWGLTAVLVFKIAPVLIKWLTAWCQDALVLIKYLKAQKVSFQDLYLELQGFLNANLVSRQAFERLFAEQISAITNFASINLLDFSASSVFQMGNLALYLVLVPIFNFLMLIERDDIVNLASKFLANGYLSEWAKLLKDNFLGYFKGKAIEAMLMTLLGYLLFKLWQLPIAGVLALGLGVSVLVPYAGIVIISMPVALVIFNHLGFNTLSLMCFLSYLILNIVDAYILAPLLLSKTLALNPLIIILAILVAGRWLGMMGVVFVIPCLAFSIALVKNVLGHLNAS